MQDVLVIGAGISGLSVAWGLARRGLRVEVWEADAEPGGKIRSRVEEGYLTERAASLLLNYRPEVSRVMRETGLESCKVERDAARNGRRYLVQEGVLAAVPTRPVALLSSTLLSWPGKLRMLLEGLVPSGGADGESVARFIRRRLGREMLEKAIDPFIAGTLASDPEAADARCTLPRLTALEQRYGSITLGVLVNRARRCRSAHVMETFSFADGMSQLVRRLAAEPGVRLRSGHRVLGIEPDGRGWRITGSTADGETGIRARRLVVSTPAAAAARLLAPLDRELTRLLHAIRYAPLAVVHLGLERRAIGHPLDGTGFLVPRREGLGINGNLWLGSLFPGRAPRGRTLLTSYVGGARHPQRVEWDDGRLADAVVGDLRPLLGFSAAPDYLRVDRHARALPLYHGNYSAHLRALTERVGQWPGLHLAANYQGGVSVRDRIVEGLKTARRVAASMAREQAPTSVPVARVCNGSAA